jgi:ParB family transcriptional regulator, chromosome partitioning protein
MSETKTRRRKSKLGRGLNSMLGDPVVVDAPAPEPDPKPVGEQATKAKPVAQATPASPTKAARRRPSPSIETMPPEVKNDASMAPSNIQTNTDSSIVQIRPSDLTPSPFQPRRSFDEDGLKELADSIKRSGVMQPIIVRRARDEVTGNEFQLVAGERRWRAAMLAGLATLPAIVRELDDERAAEFALIENVQRKDLGAMERAHGFQSLAERFSLSHAQVAQRVGLSRSSVTNLIRLTELEREIQELLEDETLSVGHGKALLAIAPGEGRLALAQRAGTENWSVRRLEQAGTEPTQSVPTARSGGEAAVPASRERLEKQLSEHLGTKVRLKTNASGTKGTMVIDFYNLDHFDGLMARMGFEVS